MHCDRCGCTARRMAGISYISLGRGRQGCRVSAAVLALQCWRGNSGSCDSSSVLQLLQTHFLLPAPLATCLGGISSLGLESIMGYG
jgi:hypothetical protein